MTDEVGADAGTIAWYDSHSADYAALRAADLPTRHLAAFAEHLPPGADVLDLGCGSGACTAALTARGFAVTGLDASAGLLAEARAAAPDATFRQASFAELDETEAYDGIWANFSLLHAPRSALPGHLMAIAKALRPRGLLHLGMMTGEGDRRDRLGRHYSYHAPVELRQMLAAAGLRERSSHEGQGHSTAGDAIGWIVFLADKGEPHG
ncbi:class I SAM-dependent DNA methyltransferase [Pseudoroseicyclus tamaricis]|uniref:Class I SAM-dependent methyltransferase n=1 Tax=Pseudoroseicyclus tamaricis TaxID=2705421 RepID=A0A6B2JW38_9RHOB|nr:class I SAM-dependent methyltransferase [Pseudoroseicyclus tamaricis]NDV02125.1 class I SAM-dependent methyltransferase [Pseudoroseicyclus tamaricis]